MITHVDTTGAEAGGLDHQSTCWVHALKEAVGIATADSTSCIRGSALGKTNDLQNNAAEHHPDLCVSEHCAVMA